MSTDRSEPRVPDPATSMDLPAFKRFGSYQVVSRLGKGGMGEVFRAHDPNLARDVAIKTLPRESAGESEWLARFRREARTLAALNHPTIAVVHGLEESEGVHYLIMELVEGDTLAERALRSGPLPVQDAVSLCTQVVEALEAAHHKSIIHRDIKPANIKVTPEGRVKVLDFGLAKRSVYSGAETEKTMTGLSVIGSIVGTPGYMSPEQVRGKEVDQRTDVWAVGCVLFELLTSRRTFDGETVNDTLAAVLRARSCRNVTGRIIPGVIAMSIVRQLPLRNGPRREQDQHSAAAALSSAGRSD